MSKQNVLVIGVGNLGIRHLQGVLSLSNRVNVVVVDKSKAALQKAKQVAKGLGQLNIEYSSSLEDIPRDIFCVIIATSSNVRAKIISSLLQYAKVQNLILEKVLFPDLEAYSSIGALLENKGVNTWVNHPRRVYSIFKHIKSELSSETVHLSVTGSNWGLGCNGLHFIDLVQFFSGSHLVSVDTKGLEKGFIESKREGFIDFVGRLDASFHNGSTITMLASESISGSIELSIRSAEKSWFIRQGGSPILIRYESNIHTSEEIVFPFQSELSGVLVEALLDNENLELPTYKEASETHKLFINSLLEHLNQTTSESWQKCMIT